MTNNMQKLLEHALNVFSGAAFIRSPSQKVTMGSIHKFRDYYLVYKNVPRTSYSCYTQATCATFSVFISLEYDKIQLKFA